MKNYFFPIFTLLIIGCGNQSSRQMENVIQPIETVTADSTTERVPKEIDIETSPDSMNDDLRGLNDIRFGNWTDKDWCDNDYYRTLRKYIDAYNNGDVENKDLDPYKSILKGKFVIMRAEPHIAGGMSVDIAFLDTPNKIFHVWIYSEVNISTENIYGYTVCEFRLIDVESPLTKENILTLIKEHPENKLW